MVREIGASTARAALRHQAVRIHCLPGHQKSCLFFEHVTQRQRQSFFKWWGGVKSAGWKPRTRRRAVPAPGLPSGQPLLTPPRSQHPPPPLADGGGEEEFSRREFASLPPVPGSDRGLLSGTEMGAGSQEAIKQLRALIDQVDEELQRTFQNMHQGYPNENLVRFLKAREWNVSKAHKMLVDCLNWRLENEIDNILSKPIVPTDLYRAVRDSQLIGLSGYSKQGLPVFAIGVGLSTFDKASVHYYVQSHIQINEYRDHVVLPAATKRQGRYIGTCFKVLDMTGLKISALGQIKLLTIISTIDDLNYPEKTETYYIVNAPYVFAACWKVVKPLLQERTRRKVQVLQGCGRDELLKIMDYSSLPHFCRREGSGSSRHSIPGSDDCYSFEHHFHQQLYSYIKDQSLREHPLAPISQGSFHVDVPGPDPEGSDIAQTIECELHKIGYRNGVSRSIDGVKITDE